ncbi:MAG: HDOD domain-containing protein [Myxococcota bacterium]
MPVIAANEITLPPFPAVAEAVLNAVADPESDISSVCELVQRDPALATMIIKAANTAMYRGSVPPTTLTHAVTRLGLASVSDLTVAACLRPPLSDPATAPQRATSWSTAIASAGFARCLSQLRRRQVEVSFLCGLLHNIGELVLLAEGITDTKMLERHYIEVGVQAVMGWAMPAPLVAAVGLHRDWPTASTYGDVAASTWLARRLACELLKNDDPDITAPLEEDPVLERLNVYPEDLERLRGQSSDVMSLLQVLR